VEWNVFNGFNLRPDMTSGEVRLGLSLGFQGGLGPASLNIDAISAGLRSQAIMLNTAAKGALTGANSNSSWWTIAALGMAGEAYQYWVGRGADVRPGVDRDDSKYKPIEQDGLFRVPQVAVEGVLREGKNIGLNQNPCTSITQICHGTSISNALNTLPGFNAFATLHDTWMNQLSNNTAINLGTMPPAFLLTYGNLIDQYRYINARRK
jgi:filamentous hemagglutinin